MSRRQKRAKPYRPVPRWTPFWNETGEARAFEDAAASEKRMEGESLEDWMERVRRKATGERIPGEEG